MRAALDAGLTVILCVGETLEQREQGITFEIVGMQTKVALGGVSKEELARVIIAYEPVWAIGTGRTATSEQANEVNHYIRTVVADLYDQAAADAFVVQYGGSMNAKMRRSCLPSRMWMVADRRRFAEGCGFCADRGSRFQITIVTQAGGWQPARFSFQI